MKKRNICLIAFYIGGMTTSMAANTQRFESDVPSRTTEGSLHRYIDALEIGQPNYEEMSPRLAAAVHDQLPQIRLVIEKMGTLKTLTFKGVGTDGWDVYEALFLNGLVEWRVKPLSADGKVEGRRFKVLSNTPTADIEISQ